MDRAVINRNFNQISRDSWVKEQLLIIEANQTILDLGSGNQPYKDYCKHLEYFSFDKKEFGEKEKTQILSEHWQIDSDYQGDGEALPFNDESIDNILCTEVLEHTIRPIKMIFEMVRVLKKNGKLILTAPFNSLTHFLPDYYYSGFSSQFYISIFKEMNLKIEEIKENGNFFSYQIQELNRTLSISNQLSSYNLSFLDRLFLKKARGVLNRLEEKDTGSSKLQCFGYHIVGIKN